MSIHKLKIYGASDDLIEVEGAIEEEFNHATWGSEGKDDVFIAISDGTLIRVKYDDDGIWRFTPLVIGDGSSFSKKDGLVSNDDNSDEVNLSTQRVEGFEWVVKATSMAARKRGEVGT